MGRCRLECRAERLSNQRGADFYFECSGGNFGECTLCLLIAAYTDENGDGVYETALPRMATVSSTIECGQFKMGTFSFGPSPSVALGFPSNLPYKVQYLATQKMGACSNNPDDYDHVVTVLEETPPF